MNDHWTLDKRIPIAIMLTIFFQTLTVVWWASALNQRVANLEILANDGKDKAERLTRVETQLTTAVESLRRIEWKLDPRPAPGAAGRR